MPGVTFVDVGAFDGRSSIAYEKAHPVASVHMFEPNPLVPIKRPAAPCTVHQSAAWLENGSEPFYISSDGKRYGAGQGSTLLEEKTTGALDKATPIRVKTIDFAEWLYSHASEYLVVKLNIEGAEYPLMLHMMATDAILVPKEWIISWHTWKVGKSEDDANPVRQALRRSGFGPCEPHTCLPETFDRWVRP